MRQARWVFGADYRSTRQKTKVKGVIYVDDSLLDRAERIAERAGRRVPNLAAEKWGSCARALSTNAYLIEGGLVVSCLLSGGICDKATREAWRQFRTHALTKESLRNLATILGLPYVQR